MIFACTNTTSQDDFVQLADEIMEVATPSISNITGSTVVEQLRLEIADLNTLIAHLQSMTSASITLPATITQSFTIYTKQRNMLVSSTFWKFST